MRADLAEMVAQMERYETRLQPVITKLGELP